MCVGLVVGAVVGGFGVRVPRTVQFTVLLVVTCIMLLTTVDTSNVEFYLQLVPSLMI